LRLLFVLQRRREATAASLARELEVSVRTLYRDVAALMAAGVPLWTEPGPRGGIRLVEGWRTKLDGLTADEAGALSLSAAPQVVAELGLASVAASARAKLDATLPAELRSRAAKLRERFLLDAPGWFSRRDPLAWLPAVAEAVWSERRLVLVYASGSGAASGPHATRRVDPLGLVLKAGTWYLVARHRRALRTYRVGRIQRATVRAERFERPAAFELAQYWANAAAAFDVSLLRYRCTLRLTARGMLRVPELIPGDAVRAMLLRATLSDASGWRTVALRLESEDVALGQLIGLGEDVEVVEPASLRARFATLAARMAARHRTASGRAKTREGA